LDTRIKNTPEELAHFDRRLNRLLNRVFDEFGLIVCGWSGKWDIALRDTIARCKSRRFATYWTTLEDPIEEAKRLIQLRGAEVIQIQGADQFFEELAEKVSALEEYQKPHPLSAKTAVISLKRYIETHQPIRVNDLMYNAVETLIERQSDENSRREHTNPNAETFLNSVRCYEAMTGVSRDLMAVGCHWGKTEHRKTWVRCLERVANNRSKSSSVPWAGLSLYPALILLYSGGLAAIAGSDYETFGALLLQARTFYYGKEEPLVAQVNTVSVIDYSLQREVFDRRYLAPLSQHLFVHLRPVVHEFLPDDTRYRKCFDRFEYLLALVLADYQKSNGLQLWRPVGRFIHKSLGSDETHVTGVIHSELLASGEDWAPLKAGLFGGSLDQVVPVEENVRQLVAAIPPVFPG
jgi:hypothetical protein